MANYYVTTGASGLGDGSIGNPWTIGQAAVAATLATDYINFADGTYTFAAPLTRTAPGNWVGNTTTPANVRFVASANIARLISQTAGDSRYQGIRFDGSTFTISSELLKVSANGTNVDNCEFVGTSAAFYAIAGDNSATITNSLVDGTARGFGFGNLPYRCTVKVTSAEPVYADVGKAIMQCVIRAGAPSRGSYVGCVSRAQLNATLARKYVANCIILNAGAACISAQANQTAVMDCLWFGSSLAGGTALAIDSNNTQMSADPFVDSANGDFRLTTAAKAQPYANRLRAIMAGVSGVPGITTDSLATLFGGGGGSDPNWAGGWQ